MSVQAGIWNFDGQPVNDESLAQLLRPVKEYGPDGEKTYHEGPVGMVDCPFYVTSEARLTPQPHISRADHVVTFDGRLDNRDELARELFSDNGSGCSDVTLVGAAFGRWGCGCFERLIGDWALAIWDSSQQTLRLARDYIGIKQLFYYPSSKGVIWSSHLAALIPWASKLTLCEKYVGGYLTSYPRSDLTPYREICSVPAASFVTIKPGTTKVQKYWTFNQSRQIRYRSDQEYEDHFQHVFRQSVRCRMRADTHILAQLSGGLDSSSIVCMADDIARKGDGPAATLETFSFYDLGEPDDDDRSYFIKVQEFRRRAGYCEELEAAGDSFSLDGVPFPAVPGFGERQELTTALSRVISEGRFRVMLSGIGGDELLGQAFDPRVQLADSLVRWRIGELFHLLIGWSMATRQPLSSLLWDAFKLALPRPLRDPRPTTNLEPWINQQFAREYRASALQSEASSGAWWSLPCSRDRQQTVDGLARQMTYAAPGTTEIRYPFLDRRLLEFVFAVPISQLTRPGQARSLMRRSLKGLVPDVILTRRTKGSSGRCMILWVQKHWGRIEKLLDSSLGSRLGYINAVALRSAFAGVRSGQMPLRPVRLLKALSLEVWLRQASGAGVFALPADALSPQTHDLLPVAHNWDLAS